MPSISSVASVAVVISLTLTSVNAHLTLVSMQGANGVSGLGFGVDPTTRRDGTARDPFQLDSAVIREEDIQKGIATVCGRTLIGGPVPMPESFQNAEKAGLPSVGPDGVIRLTGHQINADGGGPYSCAVDYSATGLTFEPIPMTVNLPGRNGRSDARAIDLPIEATIPPGKTCTGGQDGQSCIVRCLNGAKAGPFGGCLAFTQRGSGQGGNNNNNNNGNNNNNSNNNNNGNNNNNNNGNNNNGNSDNGNNNNSGNDNNNNNNNNNNGNNNNNSNNNNNNNNRQ
ncbi:secreted protein [Melampsora americana]|nr:secreted protein [Melampsora americana]